MNTDENWLRTAEANAVVVGYMIPGGRQYLAQTPAKAKASAPIGDVIDGFNEVPADQIIVPGKVGQKSYYGVLVTDMTRTYLNKFGSPDNKNGRSNHIDGNADDSSGYIPRGKGGSNVGYIDGHVDWRTQNELGQKEYPAVGNSQPGRRQFYYTKGGSANRYYW